MTLAKRCDEILRLIDSVIGPPPDTSEQSQPVLKPAVVAPPRPYRRYETSTPRRF